MNDHEVIGKNKKYYDIEITNWILENQTVKNDKHKL